VMEIRRVVLNKVVAFFVKKSVFCYSKLVIKIHLFNFGYGKICNSFIGYKVGAGRPLSRFMFIESMFSHLILVHTVICADLFKIISIKSMEFQ
jgi:hypothetical protein